MSHSPTSPPQTSPPYPCLPHPDRPPVVFRQMRFELDHLPRYWHSDSAFISHFFNALSIVFPKGERFFIDSVRSFQDEIDDPRLREQLQAFIRQEAHHGYQHDQYNAWMTRMSLPSDRWDAAVGRALDHARRWLPRKNQLAMTIALEHFTAIMAHQLLTNPRMTDGMHVDARPLWYWHAMEETEHKAVCYDVYHAIGGSYLERVSTMLRVLFLFPFAITLIHTSLMRNDGKLFDRQELARGLRFLWGRGGLVRSLLPDIKAYFRRDFHPWDLDNRELIPAWSEEFGDYVVRQS